MTPLSTLWFCSRMTTLDAKLLSLLTSPFSTWNEHVSKNWTLFWFIKSCYLLTFRKIDKKFHENAVRDFDLKHGILVEWILWLEIEELSRPQIPAKFKNIFDFGRDRSGVPSHASQTLYHWAMKAWYFKAWNILKISSGATQPGQPGHWAAQKNRSTSTVWDERERKVCQAIEKNWAWIMSLFPLVINSIPREMILVPP